MTPDSQRALENRYIVLSAEPWEGYGLAEEEPIPSFATKDEAVEHAKKLGLISPKGKRNHAEIVAVALGGLGRERGGEDELRDERQRLLLAGDALATALTAVVGANPGVAKLIAMWDVAKDPAPGSGQAEEDQ